MRSAKLHKKSEDVSKRRVTCKSGYCKEPVRISCKEEICKSLRTVKPKKARGEDDKVIMTSKMGKG